MRVEPLFRKLSLLPFGKQIFSRAVCFNAPYFSSIKPVIQELIIGRCIITMKKRRSITNHLGTVHAIAMCNLAELCAGLTLEASLPKAKRWIPKGMNVSYLKKAETDLTGTCTIKDPDLPTGDHTLQVTVKNVLGDEVFRADILMYISLKQ